MGEASIVLEAMLGEAQREIKVEPIGCVGAERSDGVDPRLEVLVGTGLVAVVKGETQVGGGIYVLRVENAAVKLFGCLLYTSPSPRD